MYWRIIFQVQCFRKNVEKLILSNVVFCKQSTTHCGKKPIPDWSANDFTMFVKVPPEFPVLNTIKCLS